MKIGLITTIETNIGDDFIRTGICKILSELYKSKHIEFVSINKHQPYTVYPEGHPIHLRKFLGSAPLGHNRFQSTADAIFSRTGHNRFTDCDLIVQCGAPVFWLNCSKNEWAKPLWRDVVGRLHERTPVLNLAAGSCYPWVRQDGAISTYPQDIEYIKSILGYCRLTTVRDRLAQEICSSLEENTPLLPCTAFLAAKGQRSEAESSGPILINYMQGGGHFDWKQEVDPKIWEDTVKDLIKRLGRRHKIAFLCHDENEERLARELDQSLPVFCPRTPHEYFDCVAGAKFAICNRMHASVGMAGLGIPSIAVCTDTRLLMVEEIGLKVHFVKDVGAEFLESETEEFLSKADVEKGRLFELQERTWMRYMAVIEEAL